ncbi:hypothetical protein Cst_c05030 [Thermoclostridium stercorarium subsp. stercorarium DSM 8532]|uniref:Flagellar Assembly Protein A N-terminal region domain-containing protein n=3 Tax=Thermoclostridium stercorarium TaxID=1510 RepID=L7VHK5_THES1|nr:FapA family protein [Thermoclostridium stercorarium]AGC67525.1 hypothetical protein Cst_c05030 [Thermoclostridium stercorarium subsp. stercorarium DSM 8532]AGI38577.1 polymerase [Thermoclostridium stercorarium subsp. stercorarium DSM 8532]ANW97950.1 hypothetical protein CSTERTH_02295 [Thermoclostridium stercorarium subsp. thermolacticum DSM 2910]ANX00500.1 hypothetical protein CSTERLE_02285 [Thermoclostridium stercorarium subsp. leptospartum DSM 9219]
MISVNICNNALEAYITLHYLPEDYKNNRGKLTEAIQSALKKANVNYGIMYEVLNGELPLNTPILIAKGKPPVHGTDSEIRMFQIPEPKPLLIDNDRVNHYELNLIHHVKAGDWLGERIDPKPGIPGIDVHGNEIKPDEGILYPLLYDQNSVLQVRTEGKDVLYALKDGAVHYVGDTIAVYDVLEVNGDVDFNTGNIDFNGYVNIKGTVEDNFVVKSTKDIEIESEYGIGGVKLIESTEGSIYIRGGVAGKGKAKIICKGNLYAKFISDAEVICEGSVFAGFYIRNSSIRAKQVIVESGRGQIVGGNIDADIKVECADIGNRMEKRTLINIRGFDRESLTDEMNDLSDTIHSRKKQLNALKEKLRSLNMNAEKSRNEIKKIQQEIFGMQEEIKKLEKQYTDISGYLKTPGNGALVVKNYVYPKVRVTIQNQVLEIMKTEYRPTYVLKEGLIQAI